MKSTLSVCMIVRDEARNLEELLPVIRPAIDDLVIVDTGSGDGTPEVARRYGARVFERAWDDDFSAARNRGLDEVTTSHVLWLDADDRIEAADLTRLKSEIESNPTTAWQLLLVNQASDAGGVSSCWQLRVFPAHPEVRFAGRIHEQLVPSLRHAGIPITNLDVTVVHQGYVDTQEVLRKSRRNLELLRKEGELAPDDVTVLYHWMKAASRAGELDEALRLAERLSDAPPKGCPQEVRFAAAIERSRLEATRGQVDAGIAVLERAVTEKPDHALVRFFLADLLRRQGKYRAVIDNLLVARVAPVEQGNLPLPVLGLARAIRLHLGEAFERLQMPREAIDAYREVLVDLPDDRIARRGVVRALTDLGQFGEAETAFAAMPADSLTEADRHRLGGMIAFGRGRDAEATRHFEALADLEPRGWAAPLHLGHLALRNGRFDDATAQYEIALARADRPEVRVGLAAAKLESGDATACLEHCIAAIDGSHGITLPAGTEALCGEALARMGQWREAREAFEAHLTRLGPDPRILTRLADCYREEGVPVAAKAGYEKALELAPGLKEAERGLEALTSIH